MNRSEKREITPYHVEFLNDTCKDTMKRSGFDMVFTWRRNHTLVVDGCSPGNMDSDSVQNVVMDMVRNVEHAFQPTHILLYWEGVCHEILEYQESLKGYEIWLFRFGVYISTKTLMGMEKRLEKSLLVGDGEVYR